MTGTIREGIWTAIVTPFLDDLTIDWESFEKLLHIQKEAKISGVVVSGTTGEAPTLTVQEKLSLIRKAKAVLGSDVQVMAGTSSYNTQQAKELSKLAQDAGADSLLLVTPPYNKPSLAGLKLHFQSILEGLTIPACLYHVPSRTSQKLSAEALSELLSIPNMVAIKEASGEMDYMSKLIRSNSTTNILSGDDFSFLGSMAIGSNGCVSVVSNIFPKLMVALYDSVKALDLKKAQHLHQLVFKTSEAMFIDSSPSPLKYALSKKGLVKNTLRLPLCPVSSETEKKVDDIIQEVSASLTELKL